MMEKVDAVIVGAGAAGSLLAAKLSQAGKKVVVLEGGPERSPSDLYSSQLWARRIKWGGPPTDTAGADPLSVNFNSGWGTGGAALHHYAVWLRRHADDFHMQSRLGHGLDWPISYQELRPYYDQVQQEVGIAGDARAEIWRPPGAPYPMPPHGLYAQARLIAGGFQKLGLRTSPLPLAINSVAYRGRPACVHDGWCDAGCPILALANPLAVYLPQARLAGASILHNSTVTRVLLDAAGNRAAGVEYFDAAGERRVQHAEVVILAAFAFQTPRILLNSAAPRHPNGLANSSGLLGKYMMAHAAANVYGLFREPTENYAGTTGGQLLSQEDYAKDLRRGYPNSAQWLIANALKPNDLLGIVNSRPELFGPALHEFMRSAALHLATMTFVGEGLPRAENRLALGGAKDSHGFPLARVTHAFGAEDNACFASGMKQGLAIFRAAGAFEVWAGPRARMHVMGGAIMGSDPRTSVADSYGQTHDVPNLVIAGPSLFPTAAAVNPIFTNHAVTLRAALHMIRHWPG
ncbi:MAG TPA: GMC family oxidoreductase [Candidatus Acidoferrales bacterium]|nr:GMC family oxidoreductase [Candidatus Acidoferrales bacterium]